MKFRSGILPAACILLIFPLVSALSGSFLGRADDGAKETVEVVNLKTQDGAHLYAAYHRPAGKEPRTAILIMHPRGGEVSSFILSPLAKKGFGALGMASRNPGRTGIHEELLLDVASGVKFLKSRGVEHVILAGHSGGGSLMAFYESQAETAPPNRVSHTPAGDPPDLNKYDLPKADGLITLNAAEGEGIHLAHHLDPSITVEEDPFSYDPSLDMYNPANGFRLPPEETHYSKEFLDRYAKAQQERAWRLVKVAQNMIDQQNYYKSLMKSPAFEKMSLDQKLTIERRAAFERPMLIFRSRADPRYCDLSLDPSDREIGHSSGPELGGVRRSDLTDWKYDDGNSGWITPREFLSTWSVISNARMWDNLGKISIPVLVINSSSDPGIFPSEAVKTLKSVASKDKERVYIIGGNHGFVPEGPKAGNGDQQKQCVDAIASWADKRWPVGGSM